MKKLNIFYLTFDGVETHYCGVGTVTQYFLASLPQISENLKNNNFKTQFYILYAETPLNNFGYSKQVSRRTKELSQKLQVIYYTLPHGTEVENPFGNIIAWKNMCKRAAEIIRENTKDNAISLVLATDTPFAGVTTLLAQEKNIYTIWIAASTSKVWARNASDIDNVRCEWEQNAINSSNESSNVFLGATSTYMRDHLIQAWGAKTNSILDFKRGVSIEYIQKYIKKDQN
ncbi:MAG TPA: hypothetical protein GXZ70_02085, partial [Clostridiales bacterium]|nr:hypothetical protein [Clostridiales bacterium]